MNEKTIDRDKFFGGMVPAESSEGRFGMLFGASCFTVENEGVTVTITESKELQEQLEGTEEWNRMSGVVPEEVLPSGGVDRLWTDYHIIHQKHIRQREEIEKLLDKLKHVRGQQKLVSHMRSVSWHRHRVGVAELGDSFSHVKISRWDWHSKVSSADNPEEIIDLFSQSDNPKFNRISDRLRELQDFYEEDPEGVDPLTIEALRTLAFFVGNNIDLPYSHISVYSDGRIYLEWRLHPQGRLAMELSPDKDLINFAAISATAEEGIERKEVSGALPEKEAIEAVRWFINRIADNAKK